MAYCFDNAIPHSVWLSEWSPEDRAKVVAFAMEKAERCNLCGTAEWEWREDKYAYEPHRQVCFGCQAKDLAKDEHDGHQAGVSIVLLPQAVARQLRRAQMKD